MRFMIVLIGGTKRVVEDKRENKGIRYAKRFILGKSKE